MQVSLTAPLIQENLTISTLREKKAPSSKIKKIFSDMKKDLRPHQKNLSKNKIKKFKKNLTRINRAAKNFKTKEIKHEELKKEQDREKLRSAEQKGTEQKERKSVWTIVNRERIWTPRDPCLTEDEVLLKALKNAGKSLADHWKQDPECKKYTVSMKQIPLLAEIHDPKRLMLPMPSIETTTSYMQGRKDSMEDKFIFQKMKNEKHPGMLMAVCDGRGGKEVAEAVTSYFEENFDSILSSSEHIHQALEKGFKECQTSINSSISSDADDARALKRSGSTIVASFICEKTRTIWTATTGDSTAILYTISKKDGSIKAMPLSCLRNWAHPQEKKRAIAAEPEIEKTWAGKTDPKALRFGRKGVNLSRAMGCADCYSYVTGVSAITEKPKISVSLLPLLEEAYLILRSDGYSDYVKEKETIELISKYRKAKVNLPAKTLVSYAYGEKKSEDNILVIVAKISPKQ